MEDMGAMCIVPLAKGTHTAEGAEAIKWWLFNHNGDTTWPEVEDENGRHIVGGICGTGFGYFYALHPKKRRKASGAKPGLKFEKTSRHRSR